MRTMIDCELPKIIEVEDYHDFGILSENLSAIFGNGKLKVREIGYYTGCYVGVVYTGTKPSRLALDASCLRDIGISLQELEDDDDE